MSEAVQDFDMSTGPPSCIARAGRLLCGSGLPTAASHAPDSGARKAAELNCSFDSYSLWTIRGFRRRILTNSQQEAVVIDK